MKIFMARMRFAADAGIKIINSGPGKTSDAESRESFFRNMEKIVTLADELDVTVALEIHGELTGKRVSDAEPAELVGAVLESMREVVSLGGPTARIAQIYPRHLVVLQSLIRLPLCDDGENVSHIVTVAQYEKNVRDSKEVLESIFS